jgi:hypothetical protein
MLKRLKGAAVGCAVLIVTSVAAYAAGYFPGFPIVGGAAYCDGYSVYSQSVTVPGTLPTPNQCNSTAPAGPTTLTGTELIPMDTAYANGAAPQTALLPANLLGGGYGGTTVFSTTGTTASVVVADGVSNFIYSGAGTATFTSFKLPPNPMNNQTLCLTDAGSGILTLSAVAASANSFGNTPTITGVTPTSIPVMTAVGTAGTVTLGKNCWLYQAAAGNTGVWYRTL